MAKKKTKKSKEKKVIKNTRIPEILAIVFVAFSLYYFTAMFFTESAGALGNWIKTITLGLVSAPGYLFPILLLTIGTNLIIEKRIFKFRKYYIAFGVIMLVFSASLQLLSHFEVQETFIDTVVALYGDGVTLAGGGVIGGLFHLALSFMGNAGSAIIYIAAFLICGVILFNISLIQLFTSVKDSILKKIAAAKIAKEKKEEEETEYIAPEKTPKTQKKRT